MHSFLFYFAFFQAKLEPISIYHPTVEEGFAAIGILMEGFFDRVAVMAETMASIAPTVA